MGNVAPACQVECSPAVVSFTFKSRDRRYLAGYATTESINSRVSQGKNGLHDISCSKIRWGTAPETGFAPCP